MYRLVFIEVVGKLVALEILSRYLMKLVCSSSRRSIVNIIVELHEREVVR